MNVAASVREAKERHPERYCPHPRCLWRVVTGGKSTPCPKHGSSLSDNTVDLSLLFELGDQFEVDGVGPVAIKGVGRVIARESGTGSYPNRYLLEFGNVASQWFTEAQLEAAVQLCAGCGQPKPPYREPCATCRMMAIGDER